MEETLEQEAVELKDGLFVTFPTKGANWVEYRTIALCEIVKQKHTTERRQRRIEHRLEGY